MSNKVLVVLPTNFGDILLTLRAIELIKQIYSKYDICALAAPGTAKFVDALGFFSKVDIFDKNWTLSSKFKYLMTFRNKFDICFDFKHSLIPIVINSKVHTPMIRFKHHGHKSDYYVDLVKKTSKYNEITNCQSAKYIPQTNNSFDQLSESCKNIFIAAGSKAANKRYPAKNWATFINLLDIEYKCIFIGAEEDTQTINEIINLLDNEKKDQCINLTGKTTFIDLFHLLDHYGHLIIGCDSAPMHVASYVDIPTIALFGPTDPAVYGPRASLSSVVQASNGLMSDIKVEQILKAYEEIK